MRCIEGVLDVFKPLPSVQTRLRLRPMLADKRIKAHREAETASQHFGKKSRLVESPLPEALHMEGDWSDKFCLKPPIFVKSRCKQLHKRGDAVELSPKFELVNALADDSGVENSRTCAIKVERIQ
jgi:hypothetical protein